MGDMRVRKVLKTLLVWFFAIATVGTGMANEGELFDIHEINSGEAVHQTVLTGSFTDASHIELAILSTDKEGNSHVEVFRLEGDRWTEVQNWPLDQGVLFVDRMKLAGRDHLLTYRIGGFSRFDLATGNEENLIELNAGFRRAGDGSIPRLNVVRDLNGDGRDDVIMPDTDGFWISSQLPDGTYSDPTKIGPPEPHVDANAYGDELTYGEVGIDAQTLPWYLSRIHQFDYDLDDQPDLAFWNDTHFEVYRQDESGGFAQVPDSFSVDVPFDFDGSYALAFQFSDRSVASLLLGLGGRFEYTILQGFPDLNGDGIADLVTLTFSGRRVFSLRGRYDVHFGRATAQGIRFSHLPDTSARTPGPAGGSAWGYASQRYMDVDGDGMKDLTMASVNTGLGGMARAMVGNSISMNLAVYRLENGAYPARPDVRRKVRPPFAPFDKRGVLFPTVLSGDVNGDGRMDLLAVERWDELSVFLGVDSSQLLSDQPINVDVEAPVDERFASVRDLDDDGKDDVVIHYPSKTESNRIVVLKGR
ncbi:MAG: hypothetical protein OXG15_03110 [Gammaproteobacteria bacterium]|nr:hypothetical protein [Gammaproteobacteria bacterium]